MAKAAVTVHNLPENSNLSRKALQARMRRLVAAIERTGARIYLGPNLNSYYIEFPSLVPIPVCWRMRRIFEPNLRALYEYLWRTKRTFAAAQAIYRQRAQIAA